jgi:predicted ATPase/DNA-binding SARP family transcriptional activator
MQVLVQGQPLPRMRSRKGLWLLALLTLRHDRPVERDWLAGTLWPDMDQSQAFANLRPIVSELRNGLGSQKERLQSPGRHTLRLELSDAEVDVLQFDSAIKSGQLADLEQAIELYKGPLLEGCTEEWVFQERNARELSYLQALQQLGETALEAGNYATASSYYQRVANLDPWSDAARQGWMEALSQSGDRNAALQVYREFVEFLRNDPYASPDEATTALYVRLRAEARGQSRPQAVEVTKPPAVVPTMTGYLPHPLTDLIGREEECLEVADRLRHSRLVTLTGMGGMGKTRLAIAVARGVVNEYADGVWLVALEGLTDAKQVLPQIASVLGLREEGGRSLLQNVTEHLRKKRLLLVLDNCEHLREASAQTAGHLLQECSGIKVLATSREVLGIMGEIAWAVPALAIPSPQLLLQTQDTALQKAIDYESVQLFVERAQSVQKSFDLTSSNAAAVMEVCAQLEGIPLAIELAAARVKALTVEQIATRLGNHLELLTGGSRTAMSRQQTLRATLGWSYSLLGETERVLLERLSVFAGGWTLDAAESVCSGPPIEGGQVLDWLTSLADKSLVEFVAGETEGRYRLLEMVRQYGAEKLETAGEIGRVKARHRDYFLALAEEAEPELMGADQVVWLERLEAERANLRAALNWCRTEEDGAKTELRLAGALYRFWEMHGHYSEGRAYLVEALTREGASGRTNEHAKALNGAGRLGYYQGDHAVARSLLEEGLALFRELGNRQGVAWSLNDLGDIVGSQGDGDTSQALYEESLALFRELDDPQGMASLLHHLGRAVREQGDYAQAQTLYEESLALFRELGNRQGIAWTLYHLGNVAATQRNYAAARSLLEEGLEVFQELGHRQGAAWSLKDMADIAGAQGDYAQAQTLYEESLTLFRELGNPQGMASLLHHLGRVVREQGDYAQAQTLYEESVALFQELGNQQGVGWALNSLGSVALEQGHYDLAQALYAEGIGILKELGDKLGTAESLEGLAAVRLAQSEPRQAVRLLGATHAVRESIGAPLPRIEQGRYDRQVEQARAAVNQDTFAAAWEEGRALTWEQAADYALEADTDPIEQPADGR